MFIVMVKFLFELICVLISIAFFTLLERKTLGYMQMRKGPNKQGPKGILQPFSDAVKLFTKEGAILNFSSAMMYWLAPIMALVLALVFWVNWPAPNSSMEISVSIVFLMCIIASGVYPILGAGYFSNSLYSLLGSLRAIAQTISYEVSLAFIFLSVISLLDMFNLLEFTVVDSQILMFAVPLLFLLWFLTVLAETNRTPFDFSEGESELVSGFNTEFSGSLFALFFLAEYGSMLFFSVLTVVFFLGSVGNDWGWGFKVSIIAGIFIWVRGSLPRLRYDKLMDLAWKKILPASLGQLLILVSICIFIKP